MSAANAALFEDDEARKVIIDLRQKFEAMQLRSAEDLRKVNEDNALLSAQLQQLRRSILDLSGQIETSRGELARIRGQDEQFARELSEVQMRQKDLLQTMEDRLKKFEPSKVRVDGLEFVADPAEVRDFEVALATLRKGDFAQAQLAFADFNRRYPSSGYTPSALFWLGNAQYAQRNYKEAVINFRALMAAAPAHMRAPEALLSIANCQVELKEVKGARKTIEELLKAYPKSEAAKVGQERLAKLK
ncbi:MAG: tol-pal system protein YbgF [Polaromonas sp.]|nr:tol-pal system protein YbgF [Polaromonas sp.]